jgi:hypothetical protein
VHEGRRRRHAETDDHEKLLPSTCTPDLKAEVQAERLTVATHEAIAHAVEPTVRAEANPQK